MSKFWVVVADASRARLFRGDSPLSELREVEDLVNQASRLREEDLVSDERGRFRDEGKGYSATERDVKADERAEFARRIAKVLDNRRARGELENVSIVAAPKFLGELRQNMSSNLRDTVLEEISKDMTRADIDEIQEQLEQLAR